jgi:hypothetical protein
MTEELANTLANVVSLLQVEPQCAHNINLLLVRYWMTYDGAKNIAGIVAKSTPAIDIITAFRNTKKFGFKAAPTAESKGHQGYLDLDNDAFGL